MKTITSQKAKSSVLFDAQLVQPEAGEKIGSWGFVNLPKSASAKLPIEGKTMVEGTINGFPFRDALEPSSSGGQRLRVNKTMHEAARAEVGDTVTIEITRVGEEPEIRLPTDLRKALAATPPAKALWAEITPLARRDWILWISSAKQTETRQRRIDTACSKLSAGERRVCCFGGLNWLVRDYGTSGGLWQGLPG